MTSADNNDLVPAQEKLEWVTPKISLMDAGETDSKPFQKTENCNIFQTRCVGPS
jgi:hypothetical protein